MTRSSDRKEYFFNKIKGQMLWFIFFLCTWNLSFYLAHVNYSCWIFSHCKKNSQNSPYSWCYIQLLHINDVSDIKNIFSMEGAIYSTFELLILIKTNLDYLWTYFFSVNYFEWPWIIHFNLLYTYTRTYFDHQCLL